MGITKAQRDELLQRGTKDAGRAATEHQFGSRIEYNDVLPLVDRDNRIHGRLDDAVEARRAVAHRNYHAIRADIVPMGRFLASDHVLNLSLTPGPRELSGMDAKRTDPSAAVPPAVQSTIDSGRNCPRFRCRIDPLAP